MSEPSVPPTTPQQAAYSSGMDLVLSSDLPRPDVIRLHDPDKLQPLHVVMIFLATAVVAGSCWLLSAAESRELVDGARPWSEDSALRAVVSLLCLNYSVPTFYPGDVKNYVLGIGAGLAVVCVTIAILSRTRGEGSDESAAPRGTVSRKRQLSSLAVGQFLIAMFLLWSFASSRWSRGPTLSLGATTLVAIQFLWAYGLAAGLSHVAARVVARLMIAVLTITSAVAIWY